MAQRKWESSSFDGVDVPEKNELLNPMISHHILGLRRLVGGGLLEDFDE
jgi:hypothetical protein